MENIRYIKNVVVYQSENVILIIFLSNEMFEKNLNKHYTVSYRYCMFNAHCIYGMKRRRKLVYESRAYCVEVAY